MFKAIILIIIGFILLIKGADLLVVGSTEIAKKFHIPEIIIGLTIVSIGTSMPELFVSATSAINGHSDLSIGNIIGSNICNLLLILGLATIIKPIKFQKETKLIEIPLCLVVTILFLILCNTKNKISRLEAGLLIILFILFILYTIYMAITTEELKISKKEQKQLKKISISKNTVFILLGIVGLKFGGDLTVDSAKYIANYFNISDKIISLTVLALGTSLPELVTSVTAAIKGSSDIAIGNIIGSNIFNMLLIIGVSALITPITYNSVYNFDLIVLIFSITLLGLFSLLHPKDEMTRVNGSIYLTLYVVYLAFLFYI